MELNTAADAEGLSAHVHSEGGGATHFMLGSIEFGKIANMTVYDCDFLHDNIDKVGEAKLIATIVDGEEVYKTQA